MEIVLGVLVADSLYNLRWFHPNDLTITVTLPHHREIKRGTLHNIIEDAGLTRVEFLNLL